MELVGALSAVTMLWLAFFALKGCGGPSNEDAVRQLQTVKEPVCIESTAQVLDKSVTLRRCFRLVEETK